MDLVFYVLAIAALFLVYMYVLTNMVCAVYFTAKLRYHQQIWDHLEKFPQHHTTEN